MKHRMNPILAGYLTGYTGLNKQASGSNQNDTSFNKGAANSDKERVKSILREMFTKQSPGWSYRLTPEAREKGLDRLTGRLYQDYAGQEGKFKTAESIPWLAAGGALGGLSGAGVGALIAPGGYKGPLMGMGIGAPLGALAALASKKALTGRGWYENPYERIARKLKSGTLDINKYKYVN